MTFWQIVGAVVAGLFVLYIACRLIFTAWHVTQKLHANQPPTKGNDDGTR